MFSHNNLRANGLLLSVLLFAGCAQNQPADRAAAPPSQSSTATANTAATAAAVAANEARIEYARKAAQAAASIPNPSTVSFDKMVTTVDDKGKITIAQLAERARISQKVTVTGFCDRNQIGNSADAAVARAISVRDELLAQGVVPSKILVRFDTKVAKKHAAEIRFD